MRLNPGTVQTVPSSADSVASSVNLRDLGREPTKRKSMFGISFNSMFQDEIDTETRRQEQRRNHAVISCPTTGVRISKKGIAHEVVNNDEQWQEMKKQMKMKGAVNNMTLRQNLNGLLQDRVKAIPKDQASQTASDRRTSIADFATSLVRGDPDTSDTHSMNSSTSRRARSMGMPPRRLSPMPTFIGGGGGGAPSHHPAAAPAPMRRSMGNAGSSVGGGTTTSNTFIGGGGGGAPSHHPAAAPAPMRRSMGHAGSSSAGGGTTTGEQATNLVRRAGRRLSSTASAAASAAIGSLNAERAESTSESIERRLSGGGGGMYARRNSSDSRASIGSAPTYVSIGTSDLGNIKEGGYEEHGLESVSDLGDSRSRFDLVM
eukprot:CAMPEP_0194067502 /NCGR_PEP_ID=MMETSP0009_2-20130614/86594_1 /TAXON_ID=210454 /ORGANISM="Grammatophora oceanica, Strain CCMP 410" /LENGTH=373 /DNA_ID=CAMNT_0038720533 /DNA_START=26 /DNA_END=1148 /DNA_ORIENTATION=+